jgi:hypothetical protein
MADENENEQEPEGTVEEQAGQESADATAHDAEAPDQAAEQAPDETGEGSAVVRRRKRAPKPVLAREPRTPEERHD